MKSIALLIFVLSAGAGYGSAAEVRTAAADLPAIRVHDIKAGCGSIQANAPVRIEFVKPEIPGPAKSEASGFATKELEQAKGEQDLKSALGIKGSFGGRDFIAFEKGSGVLDCYNATPGNLSKELSLKLCGGAVNTSPADCYKKTPGGLGKAESVELCAGAWSTAPADCYNMTPGTLDKTQSVQLCKRARTTAPAECYRKTPGTLGKTESVELCAGARNTAPADCYALTPGSLTKELSVKLCKGARDTGPADCYSTTPQGWTMTESVEACMVHHYPGEEWAGQTGGYAGGVPYKPH